MPLPGRALPAQRQRAVEAAPPAVRAVSHQREIRNHRKEEEECAARQVRRDGEEVPHERRPKVRPDASLIGVWHEPEEQPGPAEVDDWKHRADHEREDGNRLGASRDGPAPAGVHQPQNRGNQCAGVADADPKDEVGDVKGPEDRPPDSGEAEALVDLIEPRPQADGYDRGEQRDENIEPLRGLEERAQEIVGDPSPTHLAHVCDCRSR